MAKCDHERCRVEITVDTSKGMHRALKVLSIAFVGGLFPLKNRVLFGMVKVAGQAVSLLITSRCLRNGSGVHQEEVQQNFDSLNVLGRGCK